MAGLQRATASQWVSTPPGFTVLRLLWKCSCWVPPSPVNLIFGDGAWHLLRFPKRRALLASSQTFRARSPKSLSSSVLWWRVTGSRLGGVQADEKGEVVTLLLRDTDRGNVSSLSGSTCSNSVKNRISLRRPLRSE